MGVSWRRLPARQLPQGAERDQPRDVPPGGLEVGNTSRWSSRPDADPTGQAPPPTGPPPIAERIDKHKTRAIHEKLTTLRALFRNVDRHPNAEAHDKWESHVLQTFEWFSARPDLTTPLSHIVYKPDEQMFIDTAYDLITGTHPSEHPTCCHILHRIQQIRHPRPMIYPYDNEHCWLQPGPIATPPVLFTYQKPHDQHTARDPTSQTIAKSSTHNYSTSSPGASSSQIPPLQPQAPMPPPPSCSPTPFTPAQSTPTGGVAPPAAHFKAPPMTLQQPSTPQRPAEPTSRDATHDGPDAAPKPTPLTHPDRLPPPIPTQQQLTAASTAVPTKPKLQHGYIPITSYLQPAGTPTSGNVSLVTTMIKDHIPDQELPATRTDLLTVHSEDTVHIVWIQEKDQSCPAPHWTYANLVQTSAEALYKTHNVQALVDQHARSTLETTRLLDIVEKESHAYHSTTTESIADLKTQLQHHLDETMKLNTSLQHHINDYKTAHDSYNLPSEGSA